MPRPSLPAFGRRGGAKVVSTYAAVLDGVHLWLDVDGPVSLRDADTLVATEPAEPPLDLSGLTGETYDVMVQRHQVELATPPGLPLAKTPLAADGVSRWDAVRLDDGRLRLVRARVPATAELDAVDVRGDRVHLRIRPPDRVQPGCHLLLLDTDDQVLETLPVTAHDGLLEALVGVDHLPAGYFGVLRLAVGTDGSWVRIRRRADDLADAHRAVLLPELYAGSLDSRETGLEPDQPVARLRWNPDGLLALRCLDPDEGG